MQHADFLLIWLICLIFVFRKFLGSSETIPSPVTTEATETNDTLKTTEKVDKETNNLLKLDGKDQKGHLGRSSQSGPTRWGEALALLQSGPRHTTCRHKHSCIYYALEVNICGTTVLISSKRIRLLKVIGCNWIG